MIYIEGGEFVMGAGGLYPDEFPPHKRSVDEFWISESEVTNRDYQEFVDATGYITVAERNPNPEDFPGIDPELLFPGSASFGSPKNDASDSNMFSWWQFIEGANWKHPSGKNSNIVGKEFYPVVHIALEDALAYAEWKGHRLPTEEEFEYAARGGLDGATYAWGEEFLKNGKHMANTWQGLFPFRNTEEDGFAGMAPVRCYSPNGYMLYDMIGNVWEWTSSQYFPSHLAESNDLSADDMQQFGNISGLIKGGSYLCSSNYCGRYRPAARHSQELNLGTNHIGFRTVSDHPPKS